MDTPRNKFNPQLILICERHDRMAPPNLKDILLGVYNDDNILVPKFPATLELTIWCQYPSAGRGEQLYIDYQLIGPKGENFSPTMPAYHKTEIEEANRGTSAHFELGRVEFPQPTDLSFQVREQGGQWRTIKTFRIDKQS
jgi:hypothetical protein